MKLILNFTQAPPFNYIVPAPLLGSILLVYPKCLSESLLACVIVLTMNIGHFIGSHPLLTKQDFMTHNALITLSECLKVAGGMGAGVEHGKTRYTKYTMYTYMYTS